MKYPTTQRPIVVDAEKLIGKLPPHDPAAEVALVGSMLLDGTTIGEVMQHVDAADLFEPRNVAVFSALVDLHAKGAPIDMVVLRNQMAELGQLEGIGGLDRLIEISQVVPSAASARHYAGLVAEAARKRRIIDLSARLLHDAHETAATSTDLIDQVQAELLTLVGQHRAGAITTTIGEAASNVYDAMAKRTETDSDRSRLTTGIVLLDRIIGFMEPGNLIVLAGRPSDGKSALALHLAAHVAIDQGQAVGLFSLEMTANQLAERMLARQAAVDLTVIRGLRAPDDPDRVFADVALAVGQLANIGIHIVTERELTPPKFQGLARWLVARHGVRLLVVDYLQLMSLDSRENRNVAVAEASRTLKLTALDLDVPIIAVSQLNREVSRDAQRRPRLSDLRDSGAIEQDADVVMFLHCPDARESPGPGYEPDAQATELIVAKQRQGRCGTIELELDGRTQTFRELSK